MKIIIQPAEIDRLVPMPISIIRLLQLSSVSTSDIREVVRVIELDLALTANVLRWANSAWSAAQKQVTTIKEAVIRFGVTQLTKMAVQSCYSKHAAVACPGYELAENELWRHSVAAALTVECMGEFVEQKIPEVAFPAALMHDIGKLLLGRYITPEYLENIRIVVEQENLTFIQAEHRVLETDHAEIGGIMARHWKIPEPLVLAIERHHNMEPNLDIVLSSVQIANAVTKLLGIGLGSEQMNFAINSDVAIRLGLNEEKLETLCVRVLEKLADAENGL